MSGEVRRKIHGEIWQNVNFMWISWGFNGDSMRDTLWESNMENNNHPASVNDPEMGHVTTCDTQLCEIAGKVDLIVQNLSFL